MRAAARQESLPPTMAVRAPLVSVLIASRDGARYLDQALESVAQQTYEPIEIVAVDDGSGDGTPGILEAWSRKHPRMRVHTTSGIGLAGALALAVREARGTLLARQDDDDLSAPERIARQVAEFEARPELAVAGTAARMIDEAGREVGALPVPLTTEAIARWLHRAPPFVHGSVMMRRDAYEAAGGYRAAFSAAQDYDLWLRFGPPARMANLPEPLYAWRHHPGGVFSRARESQLFFAALAHALADERAARGTDSLEAFARAEGTEAFLASYPHAGALLADWGERLAREGRTGAARSRLASALRRGAGPRALLWWLATWGIALTPRARAQGRAA